MKNGYCAQFVRAYAICARWSSVDPDGSPLDGHDIAPETMREMRSDCADFIWDNRDDLRAYSDAEQAGDDFWLTRNRHGAGFWDRGLGDLGQRLAAAARIYGGIDLHIGDDGKVRS